MQVDLTPNLLDALNDALGLDLQMDDPTVMTMLVTFERTAVIRMDYDAKALREELNALEDALCEKYPDQEALLKQALPVCSSMWTAHPGPIRPRTASST